MNIRRAKPRTWPRMMVKQRDREQAIEQGTRRDTGEGTGRDKQRDKESDAALARWLAETDVARADPTGRRYWSIYTSPVFAEVWYEARNAGEKIRAEALTRLYRQRAKPGGTHPDPREPAAFSERAILSTVARKIGVQIWQQPASEHEEPGGPNVWLMTYPRKDNTLPTIFLRGDTERVTEARIHFELACMIGFITREESRMLDPEAPHGVTLLPSAPGALVLMHQFAKALLCRSEGCPSELKCMCDVLWQQYNAPPPDHEQSTDTLDREEILRRTPHLRCHEEE